MENAFETVANFMLFRSYQLFCKKKKTRKLENPVFFIKEAHYNLLVNLVISVDKILKIFEFFFEKFVKLC